MKFVGQIKNTNNMKLLVLNCGSSSIKYQLLEMPAEKVMAVGVVERIGEPMGKIKMEIDGNKEAFDLPIENHEIGVSKVIDLLLDPKRNLISSPDEIKAIGHRIVHGGEYFRESVELTPDAIAKIAECNDFAPLHNPANLKGIKAAQAALPKAVNCGTFDTAFHQTMEPVAYMYGLPYKYYEQYKIRRYGFHGSSHRYVSQEAAKMMNKPLDNCKTIVCHIGNGSSVTAVVNGKSVDTSMGFTPLEGVIMGTRAGNVDLGAAFQMMRRENLTIDQIDNIVNKQSGLKGIAGVSDMRDLQSMAANGDAKANLAKQMLALSIKKYVGAYLAEIGGADCIAFAGGIGEHDGDVRKNILSGLECFGIEIDQAANSKQGESWVISTPNSKIKVFVIQTNEEIVIARDTYKIVTEK